MIILSKKAAELSPKKRARQSYNEIADAILVGNPEPQPAATRIRSRSGYPAMNWLAKQDAEGAAALWRYARTLLPTAANDNSPPEKGMALDRRKDGTPRGPNRKACALGEHLALPGIRPRLGDDETLREPLKPRGFHGGYDLKDQGWIHPDAVITERTRFGFCAPAVAYGAFFIGAVGGLGQPKSGKRRGDVRRLDEPETRDVPAEVGVVIDAILARASLAGVGEALGAKGGYADRRGAKALREAAEWARAA